MKQLEISNSGPLFKGYGVYSWTKTEKLRLKVEKG